MARTHGGPARRTYWPNRVLVLSLLLQNPTSVEQKETTREPTAGVRVRTKRVRTHSRRLAGVTTAPLPEEILVWEIFVRLPAKYVFRCRAVCRYWCGLTSTHDFLLAHHRRQPSLLLLTLNGHNTDQTLGLNHGPSFHEVSRDPIIELGLTSTPNFRLTKQLRRGDAVLGFDDYKGSKIHSSCDGLLLLSLSDGRSTIYNPATRECAPLSGVSINTAGLYLHRPSNEYRVLYWNHLEEDAYYILMVQQRCSPRCIDVPLDTPAIEEAMMAWKEMTTTNLALPVVFRNCLHWDPNSDAGILVFDTVVESFRIMCRPADATILNPRLCDMEGSIGFSCFGGGKTVAKIWVLEDYEREIWSFKYNVKFPQWCLGNIQYIQHLVVPHTGDVLVYNPSDGHMFHLDKTGKLLEEFRCGSGTISLIGPWFKKSLIKHDFSLRRGSACVRQLHFL